MLWLKKSMLTSPQNNSDLKEVTLSERLSAIAGSLPEHCVVCDVGSDHGALPLYLLKHNLCSKAIVTDLNKNPLDRARHNLESAGVSDRASFVLTDGIAEVLPLSPDAFVIAGMGGETIVGILDRGLKDIPLGTTFVLQPMTKIAELRRYLYEFGFSIDKEELVYENNKFFVIIVARFDGVPCLDKLVFSEFGEHLFKVRNEITKQYYLSLLRSRESIVLEKHKNGLNCESDENKRLSLIRILEEFDES